MVAERHYCIPPLSRVDLDDVLELIEDMRCFVLYAPRQTGKTSTLKALADQLNASGAYHCLYFNVEDGQAAREDVDRVVHGILSEIAFRAEISIGEGSLRALRGRVLRDEPPTTALKQFLAGWSAAAARPVVLLVDETDALQGDSLLSVLRQLRSGYDLRPAHFPQSVILCGLRDVRDYQIYSSVEGAKASGASAFNIKAESLRLRDFSRSEVRALLSQHTSETGQKCGASAEKRVWELSCGQPWLVNALAFQACFKDGAGLDRSVPIRRDSIDRAKETLILKRVTHLHQLAQRLREDRVRRVVEPLLDGHLEPSYSDEDLEYARDLGLIAGDDPVRMANPIYREVVPRELTAALQSRLASALDPKAYRDAAGALDLPALMVRFQEFFRQHSEHWSKLFGYDEAGPQLILQAFLQRVVNSGGRIEREHGLGRGRTDLLVVWPLRDGRQLHYVIECKVLRAGRGFESIVRQGTQQTARYMDRCGAESGHLVVFDLRAGRVWEDRVFRRKPEPDGPPVTVWGV